jgi:hypothetical protein
MGRGLNRRQFIQLSAAAGGAWYLGGTRLLSWGATAPLSQLISPGCRRSKVKVARLYMGTSHGLWPKPSLDFEKEITFYRAEFAKMKDEFSDVEFPVDELVTSPEQAAALRDRLTRVDGILAIHFNIGISDILKEILAA